MKNIIKEEKWVLMNKDRNVIAKGVPRNRYICLLDESNKRILTYGSEGKARASSTGFYKSDGAIDYIKDKSVDYYKVDETKIELEPVKVVISIDLVE